MRHSQTLMFEQPAGICATVLTTTVGSDIDADGRGCVDLNHWPYRK